MRMCNLFQGLAQGRLKLQNKNHTANLAYLVKAMIIYH